MEAEVMAIPTTPPQRLQSRAEFDAPERRSNRNKSELGGSSRATPIYWREKRNTSKVRVKLLLKWLAEVK